MLFLKDWGGDYTSIFLLIAFFLLLLYRYKRGAAADGWKFGRLPTKSWKMSRFFLSNAIVLTGCLSFLGIAFSVSEMRPKKLGADIVFVLDNTYSMQAPVKTVGGRQLTRMDVMVEVVNDIFGMLGSQKSKNRITLISFGWDAWKLNNYPTDDYRLLAGELSRRVNRWSSMLYGREGSNLGAALIEGVIAFPEKNPTQEERKKIMIVISDGEPYGKREIIQKQIGSA